jgi:NAD(P)-dependent dehydrogenase (short-subunit alcohol dehydrogenase family)
MSTTNIEGKAVLVTGANRGIGQALVDEALRRGAKRVYAASRQPITHPDERVTPVTMDVTDAGRIEEAVAGVSSVDVLINNAGVQPVDDLSDPAVIEQSLAVNLFGPYRVTRAVLPLLTRSQGTIVNNVSLAALAPVPFAPAYSVSKAAAFSLTQSLRTLLAGEGVSVHGVLTGPTDTEMTRNLDIPKASPESVARAIFDGVERGEEEIFPDSMSGMLAEGWRAGVAKQFERQNAALVQPQPLAA